MMGMNEENRIDIHYIRYIMYIRKIVFDCTMYIPSTCDRFQPNLPTGAEEEFFFCYGPTNGRRKGEKFIPLEKHFFTRRGNDRQLRS
jgi:hypothetical protein